MKLKKLLLLIITASMVLVLGACGGSEAGGNGDEEIVLKFGHVLAPDHPYNLAAEKFKEILEENAPQPVKVEIFHSSQLGSERDLTEGLQLGTVDIAIAPGTISTFEPKMGVLDLPYIFRDKEHAYKVLDGEIGQELAKDLPSIDLRLLSYWENGFRHVTNSSKPIVTPEDLKGVKIRVPENSIYVDSFKTWGANVTTMAFGELFTALQQKTVDAQENPLALIATNKFYEAQEYLSLTGHFYGPAHVIISEHTWKKLSPEMQEAVQKAADEARDYERQLLADKDAEYLETLEAEGMKVNEVDLEAFQKASEPVWEMYRDEYGDLIDQIQNVK
ncbi:tripartite ATP-independent transporter DctP family solute receptor [Bacillus oleivorans]|uniref:Tripartite ATP-independent transporter DctP family solute receptor n=1 Tax=Bacillus oleivorans TaxID=1448271 RepID=A0A285CJB4_9BACI|nr:DctP family TRAP transporter solute-binding subunit [Bacillus oleivorans]SNX67108.1 tripartite ATP-independent transporter DctP family solute receptor [Bacillus oleivorans]